MPAGCLKPRAPPARNRMEESCGGAAGHRRVGRDELGAKMMDLAPAKLSNPDPALMLRKRLREEMEALRGIVRKAELLAGKTVGNDRAAPRRGKNGRFLAAEARPATTEADRTTTAKKRKTMPAAAEAHPRPAATEADRTTSAKKRKTMPVAVVVEPKKMSADEISNLSTRLASLSEDMPAHILEFLKKECTGHEDRSKGEIEIDIGSIRHSAMFDLKKLLDEFAEGDKRRCQDEASRSTSCSSLRQHEDGEIVEEEGYDVSNGTRRYASPVVAVNKILCSPAQTLEDGEIAEEEVICVDDAAPVATEEIAETRNSPSTSSSSCSSRSSSSSSNSSDSDSSDSSDSDSNDSSDSDSSDSDSDDESVTSSPASAPDALHKTTEATPVAVPHKALCSSTCSSSLLEDGEIEEGECAGATPAKPAKFAETVNSTRNRGSADDGSFRSVPAPVVLAKPLKRQPAAQDCKPPPSQAEYRDLIAKGRQAQRRLRNPKRQRAYDQLEEMERNATPISDWIHPMHLRQLGITPVEYAVTSEQRVSGRGSPVQRLLGLFLKAE